MCSFSWCCCFSISSALFVSATNSHSTSCLSNYIVAGNGLEQHHEQDCSSFGPAYARRPVCIALAELVQGRWTISGVRPFFQGSLQRHRLVHYCYVPMPGHLALPTQPLAKPHLPRS